MIFGDAKESRGSLFMCLYSKGYHKADCSGDLAWCCLIVSHVLSANNDIYNFQRPAIARTAVNYFAELLFYD